MRKNIYEEKYQEYQEYSSTMITMSTRSTMNQRKTAKSANSAVLPTSIMSFIHMGQIPQDGSFGQNVVL